MQKIEVSKPDKNELKSLNIETWSPWECEPSEFDWQYDAEEWCYLFEGDVTVKTQDGETHITKGDLVKFPKGLKCTWSVSEKVRKVYIFK
jgi:hypothetical protein